MTTEELEEQRKRVARADELYRMINGLQILLKDDIDPCDGFIVNNLTVSSPLSILYDGQKEEALDRSRYVDNLRVKMKEYLVSIVNEQIDLYKKELEQL